MTQSRRWNTEQAMSKGSCKETAASTEAGLSGQSLSVGAALKPQELGGEVPALAWNSGLRLLAMPLLAWTVALALHLPVQESQLLILISNVGRIGWPSKGPITP